MSRAAAPIKDTDFLTDIEIAGKWGVCDKTARRAMKALEKARVGFPLRDPLFGNKRYWPAVDAFMKRRAGLTVSPVAEPGDGEENWDDDTDTTTKGRGRIRQPLATSRR